MMYCVIMHNIQVSELRPLEAEVKNTNTVTVCDDYDYCLELDTGIALVELGTLAIICDVSQHLTDVYE